MSKEEDDEDDVMRIKIEEELIFPEESVARFPNTIGITGSVYKTFGIQYKNNANIISDDS